jgi:hypothetical protein
MVIVCTTCCNGKKIYILSHMSHMIVKIHTNYSQFHKQQWLMSVVEKKCVLCELGSEFYLSTF